MIKFVSDWAAIARADGDQLRPEFDAASTFPAGDLPRIQYEDAPKYESVSATKRFVFGASKIAALKAMVADHKVHNPTCTEVVSAIIFKCAISNVPYSNVPYSNVPYALIGSVPFTTYLLQIVNL